MSSESANSQPSVASNMEASSVVPQTRNPRTALRMLEYEAQFFGFIPKSFCDGLYNAIIDYMSDYIEPTINRVKTTCGFDISDDEMQNIISHIHHLVGPAIDKTLDKMEDYLLQNIFRIPCHVLLKEDEIHNYETASKEDVEALEQEIKELKNQIAAKKYVNECLRKELEESTPVESRLESLIQEQKVVQNALDAVAKETGADIKEVIRSAIVQLNGVMEELNSGVAIDDAPPPPPKKAKLVAGPECSKDPKEKC